MTVLTWTLEHSRFLGAGVRGGGKVPDRASLTCGRFFVHFASEGSK